jgi:polysaccharide deacetylase family protein (PEP-CTERM system associated)
MVGMSRATLAAPSAHDHSLPARRGAPRHAFTVDVEDWHDAIPIDGGRRASAERRLEQGLEALLDALGRHGVRGTFFVLGPIAREYPAVIRHIADAGHEVGCHGWSHELLYRMTPARMREETMRACDAIEQVTGQQVKAYRAAYFSITRQSLWALEVLAELGIRYDSSIFPVRNWRYGIPEFEPRPQRIDTPRGAIFELPLPVRRVLGRNLPLTGGAYFRLYPYALSRTNIRAAEQEGQPVVFYLHPWEFDPDHPRVRFHWKAWLTHYVNLRSTRFKLERLLDEFSFGTLGEVLEDELAQAGS